MPAAQKTPPKADKPTRPPIQAKPLQKGDHLFLVDGSSYIFRAYHALPPINRKSDGLQLNAVFGFCNMLWKLLRDMKPEDKPTHLAVVFDLSERTFRTEMYPDYKAHRPDPPDDLRPQFPLIREAVQAFDLPCLEQQGYEADDLIATYVREACEADATATIVSSDKDLMQLVNDCVIMFDTMKDRKIGRAEVMEKFGVPPEKVVEVQALIGDSTDNVPGVPGIGVKTAAQLIGEYGDLETLLKRASEIKQDKRRQALIEHAEQARLSKKLVTLDDRVKLDVPMGDLAVHEPDHKRLIAFLKAMEFNSLTRRVAEFASLDAGAIAPDERMVGKGADNLFPPPLRGRVARPPRRRRRKGVASRVRGPNPRRNSPSPGRQRNRPTSPARGKVKEAHSLRRRWPPRGSTPRTGKSSTARNMKPCAACNGCGRGSNGRATSVFSRSMSRPTASIRCRRSFAASRSRSRRTRPATCRLSIVKAAMADAAACSRARSPPIRSPKPTRSRQ